MLEDEIVVHNQYGSLLRDIGHYGSPAVQPDKSQVLTPHFDFVHIEELRLLSFILRSPPLDDEDRCLRNTALH